MENFQQIQTNIERVVESRERPISPPPFFSNRQQSPFISTLWGWHGGLLQRQIPVQMPGTYKCDRTSRKGLCRYNYIKELGLLLWNPSCTNSRTHTLQASLRQTSFWAGPCLATVLPFVMEHCGRRRALPAHQGLTGQWGRHSGIQLY